MAQINFNTGRTNGAYGGSNQINPQQPSNNLFGQQAQNALDQQQQGALPYWQNQRQQKQQQIAPQSQEDIDSDEMGKMFGSNATGTGKLPTDVYARIRDLYSKGEIDASQASGLVAKSRQSILTREEQGISGMLDERYAKPEEPEAIIDPERAYRSIPREWMTGSGYVLPSGNVDLSGYDPQDLRQNLSAESRTPFIQGTNVPVWDREWYDQQRGARDEKNKRAKTMEKRRADQSAREQRIRDTGVVEKNIRQPSNLRNRSPRAPIGKSTSIEFK
jgi:hypothetical protein